jgi:hypothetical protein
MNLKAQIDPELHEFIHQDRIRLFTERNEFKRLAEQNELELNETQVRVSKSFHCFSQSILF